MALTQDYFILDKFRFKQHLEWFKEEFDLLLGTSNQNPTEIDIRLANDILDQLSKLINNFRDEGSLFELVDCLNSIEIKHPQFFD